jgi:hypothetical protein
LRLRLVALVAFGLVIVLVVGYLAAPGPHPAALAEAPSGPLATDGPRSPGGASATTTDAPDGSANPASSLGWQVSSPPPPTKVALGAFIPGASSNPSRIADYAQLTGAVPRIIMWYQAWSGQFSAFSTRAPDAVRAAGAMPMISWEPSANVTEDRTWSLRTIIDGDHDAYIHAWTRAVAAWGYPIYVRPMYEMNGWWAPWCARVNGNSPAQFVTAWRHMIDIARAEGATNIRWVWSPNVDSDGLGVPFADLYPGDAYVDWVGLDGFNRGTSWSSTHWVDVDAIFAGSITRLRDLTSKPLLIGETGSSEVGGDKAAWIRDGFARIPEDFPEVRAIVWYDKFEPETGIDWRVNSSEASLAAFREVAASPAFSGVMP